MINIENNKKKDYGLQQVIDLIKPVEHKPFTSAIIGNTEEFRFVTDSNPRFVPPILTKVEEYSTSELNDARIVLVEAVGASGKSEMTKYLSKCLNCPIFDLGKTNVIAENSLTGMLMKRLNRKDCFSFMDDISNGVTTLIIDALDEGYMKTTNQGYLDFLADVVSLNSTREYPIIMLGRYNAVELAALYFAEKGLNVTTLQIEPFTLAQAKDFIDKSGDRTAQTKHYANYRETRDYILTTIEGFFKDQSSIKNHASERFIGYAPVLLSISEFFKSNTNYPVILEEMKAKNVRSVALIVDILERILKREREDKVKPQLVDGLIEGRDSAFKEKVRSVIYSDSEQCARVLYKILDIPFPNLEIDDPAFMNSYNEHIATFVDEHPFLGKKAPANIVFESYILAKLVTDRRFKEATYNYMRKNGVSYMFAYIYYSLYGTSPEIDKKTLPYLYESLRELNKNQIYYTLNIEYNTKYCKEGDLRYDIEFEGSAQNLPTYGGYVSCSTHDSIDLGMHLEHLNINIPTDFVLSRQNVEVFAPSYVKCKRLIIEAQELTLHILHGNTPFMFECDEVVVEQKYEQYLQLCGPGRNLNVLEIVCPKRIDYPLFDSWRSADDALKELSTELSARYKKLRSIILEFRSHSKHELAKYYERIDFIVGDSTVGNAVKNVLLEKGIMFRREHLYIINTDLMDQELGISYDGIRHFENNPQVIKFLQNVK